MTWRYSITWIYHILFIHCLSFCQLMDNWLLWIMLLYIYGYKFLCGFIFLGYIPRSDCMIYSVFINSIKKNKILGINVTKVQNGVLKTIKYCWKKLESIPWSWIENLPLLSWHRFPLMDLQIQHDLCQYARWFCTNWQADFEIHRELQRIQDSQSSLEKE